MTNNLKQIPRFLPWFQTIQNFYKLKNKLLKILSRIYINQSKYNIPFRYVFDENNVIKPVFPKRREDI